MDLSCCVQQFLGKTAQFPAKGQFFRFFSELHIKPHDQLKGAVRVYGTMNQRLAKFSYLGSVILSTAIHGEKDNTMKQAELCQPEGLLWDFFNPWGVLLETTIKEM